MTTKRAAAIERGRGALRRISAQRRKALSASATRLLQKGQLPEAMEDLLKLAKVDGVEMQVAGLAAASHLAKAAKCMYRLGETKRGARLLEASVAVAGYSRATRKRLAEVLAQSDGRLRHAAPRSREKMRTRR